MEMDDFDFEAEYEEELEMMRELDGDGPAGPPSRRALSLDSPYLPPGASRKRPIEESPLPHMPSDFEDTPSHPRKVPRVSSGETSLSSIPEEELEAVHTEEPTLDSTPLRHRGSRTRAISSKKEDLDIMTVAGQFPQPNSINNKEGSPSHRYSPPSPYSLSSSPSPPPSPTHEDNTQGNKPKRRKLDRERDISSLSSQNGPNTSHSHLMTSQTNLKTPSRSKASVDTRTPATPHSASRYKRTLDLSQMESTELAGSSSKSSLMDRFEASYNALRSHIPHNPLDGGIEDTLDKEFDEPHSPLPSDFDLETQAIPAHHKHSSAARGQEQPSCVLRRAPLGPHLTVTSSDGTRVYLRMRAGGKSGGRGESLRSQSRLQLLSVPFARLRESVEEERRRKLIEQSNMLLSTLTSSIDQEESQSLFGDSEDPDPGAVGGANHTPSHTLWVDKYSPRAYTELLSDDGINRTLLSWLKLWDETVFGRPVGRGGGGGVRGGGRRGEEWEQKKMGQPERRNEKRAEFLDPGALVGPEAMDDTGRPKIKLALLCGAPGLGKTTLAHIIAKHAGYNVVEMNASDDRSPEVFRQRIEAATQMQSVLTPETRPNCLIIDEIDGAPTAAINVLIDTAKRKEPVKKKKGGGILSRPIICICNDQYTPSLRQLRQHALVLFFPSTVTSRLAARLQQVSKREHMIAAMSTLMALCEKTDNDIRSCLNTLQFIHRHQQDLTLAAVQSASIGQKDARRSLFSLWKDIFQLPSGKRHTLNQGPLRLGGTQEGQLAAHRGLHEEGKYVGTSAARFYRIFSAATATGEFEKVAQGLFENYLHIKFKDPNLEAVSLAQDWVVFYDTLQHHILSSQEYTFMGYLPFLSVAFHFLFAAPSRPQIKYPHTSFEVYQSHQRSSHLLSSLLLEVPPHIRRTVTTQLLAVEMLPPLLEIISPTFRPVSVQLYSSREKQQLVDLVGTMISYNLTYHQERGPDGQYTYILDPNVEELCRFPGLPQRKQLTYSAKQLIAREIEVEKMRRAEKILAEKTSGAMNKDSQPKPKTTKAKTTTTPRDHQPPSVVAKQKKPATDFFGRVLKHKENNAKVRDTSSGVTSTHPLWFRFNEGFSNAVRRPVRIQDLL